MKRDKIQNIKLEILVSHQCNLSCRGCSNLSSRLKKFFVSPDTIANDLSVLGKFYQPEHINLNGGEPLLHPHLLEVIDAVRCSNISERIRILTNGLLLHKMPKQFWQSVDEVHVSQYPGKSFEVDELKECLRQAKEHNVYIELKYVETFHDKFAIDGTSNKQLVKRIYCACETANVWRCHTLLDGYFYKCSTGNQLSFRNTFNTSFV